MMKQIARASVLLLVSGMVSLCALSSATAQIPIPSIPFGGVGGGNPASEDSRMPFLVRFKGFINSRPAADSLAVVSMGIAKYSETYQFEVVDVKAVNLPEHIISTRQILQQAGRHSVDYNLIGPTKLLSKISQASPGTPLQIEGMFQQRRRRLILQKVDVVDIVRKGDPAKKAEKPPS
jgi:hypothetical protein